MTFIQIQRERFISKFSKTSLTMIETAKMSSKGQIVIPEHMRKKLSMGTGSRLILRQMGNRILLIPQDVFEQELHMQEQEDAQWKKLIQHSLQKDWGSKKDETEWRKYL